MIALRLTVKRPRENNLGVDLASADSRRADDRPSADVINRLAASPARASPRHEEKGLICDAHERTSTCARMVTDGDMANASPPPCGIRGADWTPGIVVPVAGRPVQLARVVDRAACTMDRALNRDAVHSRTSGRARLTPASPSQSTLYVGTAHFVARLEISSCMGDDLLTGRMIRCLDAYYPDRKEYVIILQELKEIVLR